MSLRQRLNEEMKGAMKVRDDLKLSAIRMVRAAVKNREIEQKHELDDREISEVIASLVKQRRESIRLFQDGGRADLVTKEEKELSVLLDFLPPQLQGEELDVLVLKAIAECGAEGIKDLGKVMKAIAPHVAGRADGKVVAEAVKAKLS
ncbi:MAG TPA: GatB/YqeY domain-containing protein [Geobacteraceae bacterium]|nr:GatB/YqeY domain-containing protein [Geobacteraceae bacterium]